MRRWGLTSVVAAQLCSVASVALAADVVTPERFGETPMVKTAAFDWSGSTPASTPASARVARAGRFRSSATPFCPIPFAVAVALAAYSSDTISSMATG